MQIISLSDFKDARKLFANYEQRWMNSQSFKKKLFSNVLQ